MYLITGGTGFIGRALVERIAGYGRQVRVAVGENTEFTAQLNVAPIYIGNLALTVDYSEALQDVTTVIHLAARTHILKDFATDPMHEYYRINVFATLNLARQAAKNGVKRFIFLSTIKVNGEFTSIDKPFTTEDVPRPQDPYGISKYQAELGLQEIAAQTGMEVVIIRPPLVYGPGVKANFLNLIRCLSRSVPLPIGSIKNLRSFVALDNLVDLIVKCIDHPNAANQIFLISDGEDLSTVDLFRRLGRAIGFPALVLPIPISWLYFCGALFGKRGTIDRLCLSLRIDISMTCKLLHWAPLFGVDEGLRRVAKGVRKE